MGENKLADYLEKNIDIVRLRLMGVARSFGFNDEDARDVCQNTYVRALSNTTYDTTRPAITYLATMCRNLCLDEIRRRQRQVSAVGSSGNYQFGDGSEIDILSQVPSRDRNHTEVVGDKDTIDLALGLIDDLPDKQRRILMSTVQGKGYSKISELEKFSLGTVKSGLNAARRKMKRMVYGEMVA